MTLWKLCILFLVSTRERLRKAKGRSWCLATVFAEGICFCNTDAKVDDNFLLKISFVSEYHIWNSFQMKAHTVLRAELPHTQFKSFQRIPPGRTFVFYGGKWNNPDSPDVAGAASEDPAAQVYPNNTPTFPPPCRSPLSRNFQSLWEARQLPGVRWRGQTRRTAGGGGSIPIPGPLSPLLSVIVLTEVEWWRGGGSRGVKPCLLCLGVLESRSRLDLIFTPSSSALPWLPKSPSPHLPPPCSLIPRCLFHFSPSWLSGRAYSLSPLPPPPTSSSYPPHPSLPCLQSLTAPNASRLSGISSCPLRLEGWGRSRKEGWQKKNSGKEKETDMFCCEGLCMLIRGFLRLSFSFALKLLKRTLCCISVVWKVLYQ